MTEPSEPRPEDVAEALRAGRRPSDLPGARSAAGLTGPGDQAGRDDQAEGGDPAGVEPAGSEVPPDLPGPDEPASGGGA